MSLQYSLQRLKIRNMSSTNTMFHTLNNKMLKFILIFWIISKFYHLLLKRIFRFLDSKFNLLF